MTCTPEQVRVIADGLAARNPGWVASETQIAAVVESVNNAPPMTDEMVRGITRILMSVPWFRNLPDPE